MIYLDNAATTFPKPRCMIEALNKCILEYCGNPGRSGHHMSQKAAEKIYECRCTLASFFGSDKPENVVFTSNTTEALNIAIKGLYKKGGHILISNMEHNSVLRPIYSLSQSSEIEYSVFNVLQSEGKMLEELDTKIRHNTTMLVMAHASNICDFVFPVKAIGDWCHKNNITFVVDAAQSAGTCNINISDFHSGALCFPSHKGLYGPQGLGGVIFGEVLPIRTILEGGNGVNSFSLDMGLSLPESFEAGTVATPLIAGLDASVKWVKNLGCDTINAHEKFLARELSERLLSIKGTIIYGNTEPQSGIVLFNNSNLQQHQIEQIFADKKICTRSGLHCAPLAHATLGTPTYGATRLSISYFNTLKEIDAVYKTIKNAI